MRTIKICIALSVLALAIACNKSKDETVIGVEQESILVENNEGVLNARLTYPRTAIELTTNHAVATKSVSEKPFWELIAEVTSPIEDGEALSATHVEIVGDYAYVSYHRQGTKHVGALDVIDISEAGNPTIVSSAILPEADVNAVGVDKSSSATQNKIWLATSDRRHGGVIYELNTLDGKLQEGVNLIKLYNLHDNPSGRTASANSVFAYNNNVFATSGKSYGGTYSINTADYSPLNIIESQNMKYVTNSDNKIISLQTGDNAFLQVYENAGLSGGTSYDIGSIAHENVELPFKGKNTLYVADYNKNYIYTSLGSSGLAVFDITTGLLKFRSAQSMLTNGNTNAVTVDDEYLYIANGADGLGIATIPTEGDVEISPVFTWDLNDEPASVNFVAGNGEYVFVAKGQGGFKILRKGKSSEIPSVPYNGHGVPLTLAPDVDVCDDLEPTIYNILLPELQDAPANHPEYFVKSKGNIEILKETEVQITFVKEGAGFKNTFGYYYYEKGDEPTSIEDLRNKGQLIIFPNVSADGSGGKLIQGNSMKALGAFKENTVLGFFLIAGGWNGHEIVDGYYTIYTNNEFNRNQTQQHLLLYDEACKAITLTFEDIRLPNGDKDYNDAVFLITTSEEDAVSFENIYINN